MMNYIKRKYIKVNTIVDTLKPFILAHQMSGMLLYSIREVNGLYVVTKRPQPFLLLVFLIVSHVYYTCVYISLSRGYTVVEIIYNSNFLEMNDNLKNILGLIMALCMNVITLILTSKQLYTQKLNTLLCIQKWFAHMGIVINYTKLFTENVLLLISHFVVHSCHTFGSVYLTSIWSAQSQFCTIVAGCGPTYLSTVFILFYIGIIRTTSRNLEELKKQMTDLKLSAWNNIDNDSAIIIDIHATYSQMGSATRNKIVARKLRVLAKIYDKICDLTDSMNEGFGLHCLVICTFAFTMIVINLFFALHTIIEIVYVSSYSRRSLYFFYFSLHQCLVHVINMVMLAKTCSDCQTKAKDITIIVTKMSLVESDVNVIRKLQHFTILTMQRVPVFSACGLYNINNTMIFKMVGAATTYLVILAQFQITSRSFYIQVNNTVLNELNTRINGTSF